VQPKTSNDLSSILSNYSINITVADGLIILILALLLGLYLRYLFGRFTNTFSSKIAFGNAILVITLSVAALIAVVKSSLALSLGLVGALSVVRFRTAIKEPYNLAFLLLSICVGIAVGASQYLFAIMIVIAATIIVIYLYKERASNSKRFLGTLLEDMDTLAIRCPVSVSLEKINTLLVSRTDYFKIISWDVSEDDGMNLAVKIRISDHESLRNIENELKGISSDVSFSFYSSPTA